MTLRDKSAGPGIPLPDPPKDAFESQAGISITAASSYLRRLPGWLGDRDSNPDSTVQSRMSYR